MRGCNHEKPSFLRPPTIGSTYRIPRWRCLSQGYRLLTRTSLPQCRNLSKAVYRIDRCFPFLFVELETATSDLDFACLKNLHQSSQALYNIYLWMADAEMEATFFKYIRVYSSAVSATELRIRSHRSSQDPDGSDAKPERTCTGQQSVRRMLDIWRLCPFQLVEALHSSTSHAPAYATRPPMGILSEGNNLFMTL